MLRRVTSKALAASAVLLLATVTLYSSVSGFDFVNYDDNEYVYDNPVVSQGLTWEGVTWAFGEFHLANWQPLTWLSHMLDVELFGLEAGRHHLGNVLLHAINAVLLFLFLFRTTGAVGPAFVVAALFAVHPLKVQSVAWISERKDVLSGLFFMLTLLAYARYARAPAVGRYVAVLLLFATGLLVKPMLVTLPFVFLLLDLWPLRRALVEPGEHSQRSVTSLALEKLPLLALAIGMGLVTLRAHQGMDAISSADELPLEIRVANALQTYAKYLELTFWPSSLAAFHPHPAWIPSRPPLTVGWRELAIGAGLVAASVGAILRLRREPYLATGWFWFLGTLLPVIGLYQVGEHAFADRYTYLPQIGFTVALVWWLDAHVGAQPWGRIALPTAAALALTGCAVVSWKEIPYWRDSETLFERALVVTEDNYLAHYNMGVLRLDQARWKAAARHLEEALRIRPDIARAHLGLGLSLVSQQRLDEADRHFRAALELEPENVDALVNLGGVRAGKQDYPHAATYYKRALALDPGNLKALSNLGHVQFQQGNGREAVPILRSVLVQMAEPPLPYVYELAWILATSPNSKLRSGSEALQLAEYLQQQTGGRYPHFVEALAAAHAELGNFKEAIRLQIEAVRLQPAADRRARLRVYRSRKPYRSELR